MIDDLCQRRDAASLGRATELAALPLEIRGFGPVKAAAIARYHEQRSNLLKPEPVVLALRRVG